MSRLIDSDALMEKLNGIWDCNDMTFEPVDGCCIDADCKSCRWRETIEYVKRLVQNQTTVSPWHRVKEELPEPNIQCLVRDDDNNCAVGYYRQDARAWDSPFFGWVERDDEYYEDGDLCRIGKVVAWMPIEPPKEDEHGN